MQAKGQTKCNNLCKWRNNDDYPHIALTTTHYTRRQCYARDAKGTQNHPQMKATATAANQFVGLFLIQVALSI
jgi:hypothetical protein